MSLGQSLSKPVWTWATATLTAFLLATVIRSTSLQARSDDAAKKEQAGERLREMQQRVRAIQTYRLGPETRKPVELIEEPLFRFNDAARDFPDGTLWAWGRTGRPAALLCLALYTPAKGAEGYVYEFISLSAGLVLAEGSEGGTWSPQKPGLSFQAFPDSPSPADTEAGRLRQLKELARRFTAFEFLGSDHQRYELRLLQQPVRRYADPDSGVLDGALFLFAYGTNPEVAVVIESQREGSSAPVWRYGLARIASAELIVHVNDREVWHEAELKTPWTLMKEPYWGFGVPLARKGK